MKKAKSVSSEMQNKMPHTIKYIDKFQTEVICTRVAYSLNHPLFSYSADSNNDSRDNIKTPNKYIDLINQIETNIDNVGLQIWDSSLIMADWLIENNDLFKNVTAMELGCGVGMVSILLSLFAKTVYATDNNLMSLQYCQLNIEENLPYDNNIFVKNIDWNYNLNENSDMGKTEDCYRLTPTDVLYLKEHVELIVACDVAYDEESIDGFLRTVHDLLLNNNKAIAVIFIQKRIILSNKGEKCAPHFDYFFKSLNELHLYEPENYGVTFVVDEIVTENLDHYLLYQSRPTDVYGFKIRTVKI